MELTPKIPHSIMQYGAPLGRKEWNDNSEVEYKGKLYLRHIPLDSGGYDAGGAYWGIGTRLYGFAAPDDSINGYLRACDRAQAKEQVREQYPQATFFN